MLSQIFFCMLCVYCLTDPAQSLLYGCSRASQIQADKSVRALHKHISALKKHACLIGEKQRKMLIRFKVCT